MKITPLPATQENPKNPNSIKHKGRIIAGQILQIAGFTTSAVGIIAAIATTLLNDDSSSESFKYQLFAEAGTVILGLAETITGIIIEKSNQKNCFII